MNLDPNFLLASMLFGCFGMAYFLYGKKQSQAPALICGIVLMVFPYIVTELKYMIPIGIVFVVLPFFVKAS